MEHNSISNILDIFNSTKIIKELHLRDRKKEKERRETDTQRERDREKRERISLIPIHLHVTEARKCHKPTTCFLLASLNQNILRNHTKATPTTHPQYHIRNASANTQKHYYGLSLSLPLSLSLSLSLSYKYYITLFS